MNSEDNFKKVAVAVTSNGKYEDLIHDVCHLPHVMNLSQFYKVYELEEKSVDEKYANKPHSAPTTELFEEVFKKLDEYPANLQKIRKHPLMRDRLNSSVSRSSPTLNDSSGFTATNKENSVSLSNLNKLDDVPSASETLSKFVQFQKDLRQLKAEIMQNDVEKEHVNKLKQLTMFSQQLQKLLPTEKVVKQALTNDEERILKDLVVRMDELNFIRSQDKVSHKQALTNNFAQRLDILVDILSYCLLAINSVNIN